MSILNVELGDDVRDGIYLPKGLWMDASDGKVYEGGRILNDFDCLLWKLPVFIKAGSIVPFCDAHLTPGQRDESLLQLLVVPDGKSSFSLYDDDGRTTAYQAGDFSTTLIESELSPKGKLVVTVHPTQGGYAGRVDRKAVRLCIPTANADCKAVVRVNGKKLLYLPRPDAGNGTILQGTVALSRDRQHWTEPVAFQWARNASAKELPLEAGSESYRYVRMHVTEAVGQFGSGQQLYIFRQPGSEWYIPGDINQDGRIDENDLTSYMNYTGLRKGDGDFDGYISKGVLNANGLIDAYDCRWNAA